MTCTNFKLYPNFRVVTIPKELYLRIDEILHEAPGLLLKSYTLGAPGAQWVKCPTSAQVMISRFVGSRPVLGLVVTARSLEPASDSVSPSLSLSLLLPHSHAVCLSQK